MWLLCGLLFVQLMQMCFESLHSPAIYSISSGVLSAFSTGRTSALVIDIGAAGTRIMPVVDGYELRRCSVFTRRGGNWLDDILLREMNAQLRKTYPGITAPPLPTAGAMKGKATTAAAAIAMNKQYAAAAASGAGMRLFDVNNSVVRPWFEAKPAASSATTTAAAAAVRRPVQPTFREFHIRGVVQDLKEWMCFVPYAPIALPEHLLQPKPVSQPAPPPGKSTASAAAAAAAAVTSATMSVMQQHADAVSEYRVQELQNRSLQFPPPYELPDGHHVVATDRICTAPEQMFFTAPLPEPVVIMQPPKVPRSKSKTASNAAAQAAAAQAAVNAQAAAQAAAVAAASKKRARVILEEQTANAAAAVDALISAGAVGADGITGASSSVENTSSKVSSSSGSSSSSGRLRAGGAGISISSSVGALSNVKVDEESLSDLVFLCVSQCDVDVRRELLGNIHIVGGGSRIDGIAQRLAYELTEIVPSHIKVKVVSALPAERHYAPWIGGSILSMCGTFQQLWLTRAEYEEQGPERCVQRFDH